MSELRIGLSGGQSRRLLTGGKYVPDNIVVSSEDLEAELTAQDALLAQIQSALAERGNT